ncbi:hypothetical protein [Capnocytophaga sp.]|uniref:hypothetical protein n=1 Tax=Capnocytophaga sp. TaxID=44737 RepID=UPI0026DD554D|nr:hypothetical protein [Capnocytophaga sp.]MDO5104470.1 hypothetical protein [Capnocytophaga sp.]
MEDYKALIKEMLLRDFSPRAIRPDKSIQDVVLKSTIDVLQMVRGVIPQSPIDEHDIFDALKETGFQYGIDEKQGLYLWFLFKKM